MDLINLVLKVIAWVYAALAIHLHMCFITWSLPWVFQLGVHLHIEGANYLFFYYSLIDINLIVTLHLYFVLNMHLGNYHLALAASWSLDCLTHVGLVLITFETICSLALQ